LTTGVSRISKSGGLKAVLPLMSATLAMTLWLNTVWV
jgi:hypothetical protein